MSFSVTEAYDKIVLPNVKMQVNPDIINNGGVSIPFLISKPGCGKTAIGKQKSEENNYGMFVLHPANKPQEEYSGMPKFKRENGVLTTEWSRPEIYSTLFKYADEHEIVLFFWDDIHLCGSDQLALMQECYTERSIRGYKLPDNVAIFLAGNDSNKAGARLTSSAITGRVIRIPVEASFEDWKMHGLKTGLNLSIISFLENPLHRKFFHEDELMDEAWAQPRQWTKLSNFINNTDKLDLPTLYFLTAGHVGVQAATHYVKSYEIYSKFDMHQFFNSENIQLPEDEGDRFVMVFAIMEYCIKNYSRKVENKLIDIIVSLLKSNKDLGVLLLKEIVGLDIGIIDGFSSIDIIMTIRSIDKNLIESVLDERD